MEWDSKIEYLEENVEKSTGEDEVESSILDELDKEIEEVPHIITKENLLKKIEENFHAYMVAIDLFNLGDDVDEFMNVIHDSFDINLAILESKFGVSKEDIEQYINRRDEIIKPYVNANKTMLK